MKRLMWKDLNGNWIEVRKVSDDEASATLANFRKGHPSYEYKLI